jgi:hypothetical protein
LCMFSNAGNMIDTMIGHCQNVVDARFGADISSLHASRASRGHFGMKTSTSPPPGSSLPRNQVYYGKSVSWPKSQDSPRCPKEPTRKIPRDIHEHARDVARFVRWHRGF